MRPINRERTLARVPVASAALCEGLESMFDALITTIDVILFVRRTAPNWQSEPRKAERAGIARRGFYAHCEQTGLSLPRIDSPNNK